MSTSDLYGLWLASQGGASGMGVNNPDRQTSAAGDGMNPVSPPMGSAGAIGALDHGNPFSGAGTAAIGASQSGPAFTMASAPGVGSPPPRVLSMEELIALLGVSTPGGNPGVMGMGPTTRPTTAIPGVGIVGGEVGAHTIQDITEGAMAGYNYVPGMEYQNPSTDFLTSSGLPVNEAFLSQNIWDNPQMAIAMGGVADIGTPGYNNLANMGFDPYMVYLAQGGDLTGTTGVEYANWLADLYTTMGTTADKGGGSIAAGPLLANLVSMPPESDLGIQMAESPQIFYDMANGIIQAGGVSPMAEQAFKGQMANLYMEYLTYMSSGDAKEVLPINQWIAKQHPEVVESWAGGN